MGNGIRLIEYTELMKPISPSLAEARRFGVTIAFRYNGKTETICDRTPGKETIADEFVRNFENGILGQEKFDIAINNLANLGCAIELGKAAFRGWFGRNPEKTDALDNAVKESLKTCKKLGLVSVLGHIYDYVIYKRYRDYAGPLLFELLYGKEALKQMESKYPDEKEYRTALNAELSKFYNGMNGTYERNFRKPGSFARLVDAEKDLKEFGFVRFSTISKR